MERHTYSINFSACKSKARKTGLVPINVSITLNGERVTFATGKYIKSIGMNELVKYYEHC